MIASGCRAGSRWRIERRTKYLPISPDIVPPPGDCWTLIAESEENRGSLVNAALIVTRPPSAMSRMGIDHFERTVISMESAGVSQSMSVPSFIH
jgi:hypothetical protein